MPKDRYNTLSELFDDTAYDYRRFIKLARKLFGLSLSEADDQWEALTEETYLLEEGAYLDLPVLVLE
jgi:uncharacterized protein YfbU (UPF0304 family)